jgi:hypothetical protein
MKPSTTISALIVGAGLLGSAAAFADAPARPFRLDVSFGALAGGSDAVVGDDGIDTDPGLAGALGFGYAVTEHVEVGATTQAATSTLILDDNVGYTSVTAGARVYPLGRDLRVRPWLVGQGGWYRARITREVLFADDVSETEHGGGINGGAGIDVPLGRLVSIGVDARYHQTFGVFDDPGFVTTMANVAFHFGR